MTKNKSSLEGKTDYELEKIKSRFSAFEGQNQGVSHSLDNQWVPKCAGSFGYAIHLGGVNDPDKKDSC